MERRRPNRELKNSEDVHDALIEDYFRYNDRSRMETDDVLMNITEIESPNYEYVELDLLNLPNLVEIRILKFFLSVLHPNLVSSLIKGILEISNLTPRCIPMDILAWTDCVRSSAGKIS